MNAEADENLMFVHHAGKTTAFARTGRSIGSRFGGPLCLAVTGASLGPRPLHQIGGLALADIPTVACSNAYVDVPLIYGMCFEGCDLSYRVSVGAIEVSSLSPDRSSDDWPYERYPLELPAVPLGHARSWSESWEEFRERLIPNLNEWATSKVTVVVPPPKTLGFSLWGPEGDAEGVSIVFQYACEEGSVRAFNHCS
ncbi:MAG: hypothetical protein ACTHL8_16990 [Burkholderiaceae bacterium]